MNKFISMDRLLAWIMGALALALMLAGFILNPVILGRIFAPDGMLDPYNAKLLTVYNILMLGAGALLALRLRQARSKGSGAVQSLAGNLAKSAFAVAITLGVLEVGLQFFGKETYTEYLTRFHADVVHLNRDGFRDVEIPIEKPKGAFRILVLGDSYTFGVGVADFDKTYPRELESMLRTADHPKVELITRAVPGWSTSDELAYIKKDGLAYHPDLVIIGYVMNDPDRADTPAWNYPGAQGFVIYGRAEAYLLLHSRLYNLIWARWNRALERFGVKETYTAWQHRLHDPTGASWQREVATLIEMEQTISSAGATGVIAILPVFTDFTNYEFVPEHTQVRATADRAGFLVMDMAPEFGGTNARSFWSRLDDPHPNEAAHGIFAKGLQKFLESRKLVP